MLTTSTDAQKANGQAIAYVLTRLESQFQQLGLADPLRGLMSYGSLRINNPEPASFVPESPWALVPFVEAMGRAVADTHRADAPLVLCFANTAWRLLIACRTVAMPAFGDGATFGSLHTQPQCALLARLHLQPFGKQTPDPNPLRSWHVVLPATDDAAKHVFFATVLAHALRITQLPTSPLTELHEDYEDGEQP